MVIAIDGIVLPYSTAAKQGTCSGLGETRGEQPVSRFLFKRLEIMSKRKTQVEIIRNMGLSDPDGEIEDCMTEWAYQSLRENLMAFKQWYDKLTPSEKCTVWAPPGSGSGPGLYDMSDEDLIEKFLKKKS